MKKTHDYIHHYKGYWSEGGRCRIRIYQDEDHVPVVVCTQLPDTDNTSITNMAEYLVAEVIEEHGLSTPLVWIEHYPEHEGEIGEYSLVDFSCWKVEETLLGGVWRLRVGRPRWSHLDPEEVEKMTRAPTPGAAYTRSTRRRWALNGKLYDVAVVGSGPAGYAAAIQAARSGLRTLVLQGFETGGRLMLAREVHGYPGVAEGVSGLEFSERMEQQALEAGAELHPWDAVRADLSRRPFTLWTEGEDEPVSAKAVIVTTGARARRLGVEGEQRLMGRGVSVCAQCDGFFRDKKVAVVGGGDWAMQEALFLTRYASEVALIHRRGRFRGVEALVRRVRENPKISFLTNAEVEEVLGEHSVEGIVVKGTRIHARRTLEVEGLFVAIGSDPHLGPFAELLDTDEAGYVVCKQRTMTSVAGVFAAGEVADGRYRQTATAVGDGIRAAMDTRAWLEEGGGAETHGR